MGGKQEVADRPVLERRLLHQLTLISLNISPMELNNDIPPAPSFPLIVNSIIALQKDPILNTSHHVQAHIDYYSVQKSSLCGFWL
jgi:hypothetical protein